MRRLYSERPIFLNPSFTINREPLRIIVAYNVMTAINIIKKMNHIREMLFLFSIDKNSVMKDSIYCSD